MKAFIGIILIGAYLLLNGCSHDPVYPDIGSLYVSTTPTGAEILIDGVTTGRFTPAKTDGIKAGYHQVTLKYYRCKEWTQPVEIKPGQTKMLMVALPLISPKVIQNYILRNHGEDMAYVPEARKIFIASEAADYLTELTLNDSTIISTASLPIGFTPLLVAASFSANRIYTLISDDKLAVLELSSGILLKVISPPRYLDIKNLTFSADGQYVYTANAADSSICIYQTSGDSLIRTINLDGAPSEVTSDLSGNNLYVIFDKEKRLAKIDANTGSVLANTVTGKDPIGFFWGENYQTIGLCNSSDRTLLLADAGNLASVTSPVFVYGQLTADGCFSPKSSYIWALQSYITAPGDDPPPPGYLQLLYLPTNRFVGQYLVDRVPLKMAQSPDGRFIYVLNYLTRNIMVVRTDLMD